MMAFLQRKFIALQYNQAKFVRDGYFEEAVTRESLLTWIPLNSQIREQSNYKISQTFMELQDYEIIELDDLTKLEIEESFVWKQIRSIPYEFPDAIHSAVAIELDLSLNTVERSVYTYVDLLSDVGGIQGIMVSTIALIVSYTSINSFDNYLVQKLYKFPEPTKGPDGEAAIKEVPLTPDAWFPSINYFFGMFIPECCRCLCLKRSTREAALLEARERLQNETNVIDFVQK